MKLGAIVMYQVHVVLQNFMSGLRQNLIYEKNTMVGFLWLEKTTSYKTVQETNELEYRENVTIHKISELRPLEIFFCTDASFRRSVEKMEVVQRRIPLNLDVRYRVLDESLEVTI